MTTTRPIASAFKDSSLLSDSMCASPKKRLLPSFQNIVLGCLIASLVPLAGGCHTIGHRFPIDRMDDIKPGVWTKADVRRIFGKPVHISKVKGLESWTYLYTHATPLGVAESYSMGVQFDDDGIVFAPGRRTRKAPRKRTEQNDDTTDRGEDTENRPNLQSEIRTPQSG